MRRYFLPSVDKLCTAYICELSSFLHCLERLNLYSAVEEWLGVSSVKSFFPEVKPFGRLSAPQLVHVQSRDSGQQNTCIFACVFNDLDTTVELHNTLNCSYCNFDESCQQHFTYVYGSRGMPNVYCCTFGFTIVMTTRCVECMFFFDDFFSAGRADTLQLQSVIAWHD